MGLGGAKRWGWGGGWVKLIKGGASHHKGGGPFFMKRELIPDPSGHHDKTLCCEY